MSAPPFSGCILGDLMAADSVVKKRLDSRPRRCHSRAGLGISEEAVFPSAKARVPREEELWGQNKRHVQSRKLERESRSEFGLMG